MSPTNTTTVSAILNNSKDGYVLPRQGLESCRLLAQHALLTDRQGWLLHPTITEYLNDKKGDITIGDLATGNGIWLLQMSEKYPQIVTNTNTNANKTGFIGLDISPKQFPPSFAWPENVEFDIYNIFESVPEKYLSRFDVLNIRLIIAAINNTDKDAMVERFKSMLKPGGFIQWSEAIGRCFLTVDESLQAKDFPVRTLDEMAKISTATDVPHWLARLREVLDGHGFEEVVEVRPPFKKFMLQAETEMCAWTLINLMEFLGSLESLEARQRSERGLQLMREDLENGVKWVYNWLVVIGRRPL